MAGLAHRWRKIPIPVVETGRQLTDFKASGLDVSEERRED